MPTFLTRLRGAVFAVPLALTKPILRWADAHHRKRGAHGLRPPGAGSGSEADTTPRAPRLSSAAMRTMRDELGRALGEHETHRQTFRHLARFERKFAKSGIRAVEEVPIEQLRRALRNFEALVRNWSSPALADLRSRMAVTLADRSSAASVWIAVNSVSSTDMPRPESMACRLARPAAAPFRPNQQVDVADISMSHFEAAVAEEWHSTSAAA